MPHDLEVLLARCSVTGQLDHCVRLHLGDVSPGPEPLGIFATFSAHGLRELADRLATAPPPLRPVGADAVRTDAAYQWAVVLDDGVQLQQYPVDGDELPLGRVPFGRVAELWWVSRWVEGEHLPWYGLVPGWGFVRSDWNGDGRRETVLAVPAPPAEFQWNIYRRVTRTLFVEEGIGDEAPPHIQFVLGWQAGDVRRVRALDAAGEPTGYWAWEGDGLLCEIAVEASGDWQVYQREELGEQRFG